MLRPGEAAEALNVTTETVRRWVELGRIKGVKLPSGHLRIPQQEIDRILGNPEHGGE